MQLQEIELCSSIAHSMHWKNRIKKDRIEWVERLLSVASNSDFEFYLMI